MILRHQLSLVFVLFILFVLSFSACTNKKYTSLYEKEAETNQTAVLIAPIELDLVSHNGEDENFLLAYKAFVNYRLLPGKHSLGFQYDDLVLNDDSEEEIVKSKIVYLNFVAEAGETYRVEFTKPDSYVDAKQMETKLQISLSHNQQLFATSVSAAEKTNSALVFSKQNPSNTLQTGTLPPVSDDMSVQQLKFWWKNASITEQENFLLWVKENGV